MNTKLNFRSVVFKRAYLIVKKTGCTFSQALTLAWARYRDFKAHTINELTSQINGFDFYYYMSDSFAVNRRWSIMQEIMQDQITKELKSLPMAFISAITGQLSNVNYIRTFIKL